LLLREPDASDPLEVILIDRLQLARDWLVPGTRLALRALLGPDGAAGLLSAKGRIGAKGTVGSRTSIEVSLRALQANRLLPHLPSSWDVRSASGVLDGDVDVEGNDHETRAEFDLALRGGGVDVAGVGIAGETRLGGQLTLGAGELALTGGTFSAGAIQAYDYSATGLTAEFDWAGEELDLHALELSTVSAGLTAAAALGLPGGGAVPLALRVEKAGKLSLRGSLSLPDAGESDRQLSLPNLSAVGTELALVRDPGLDETVTRLHVDRLLVAGYATGETATAELEAHILGAEVGRVVASASLGPLSAERGLLEHPLHVVAAVDDAPPEALLPYVPESWVVPRALGPVDIAVDLAGTVGHDLAGEVTVESRFGSPPGPTGSVVVSVRTEAAADSDDAPTTIEVTVHDLDLDLLDPLPESWRVDSAAGLLNAAVVLYVRDAGEFEGEFESDVQECHFVLGDLTLGGNCSADGRLVGSGRAPTLPAFDLDADTARFREIDGTQLRMRGLFVPPALQIESATVNAWDGDLAVGGTVLFERPPQYELEATGSHLSFAALLNAPAGSERARDPNYLDAYARVRGTWRDAESWLAPVSGTGQIDVYEGAVVGMPLRRAIAKALLSIVPGSNLVLGDRPQPRTPLEYATLPFSIEEGRIRLEGVQVATPDYRLRAHGEIGPDFSYRFDGNAILTPDGLRHTLALVSAPGLTRRALTLPAIPLTAKGSFGNDEDADVRVDATAVTVNVARAVLGLPLAAGKTATGAVRRGLGALRPKNGDGGEAGEESP
jgi:hypothetical protein